jgi:SAM-dependent methyltransferase
MGAVDAERMRVASKCLATTGRVPGHIDRTAEEFARTMGYGSRTYESQAEFLRAHAQDWVRELHEVFRELLDPGRTVLSIGSGECEHEIPFVLDGYDILSTDVVASASESQRLFPTLRFQLFDVLNPTPIGRFDDVLIGGLDFYFPDREFSCLLGNTRGLLRPGGRLLFTLRYRDNLATWLIDRIGIPLCCSMSRLVAAARQNGVRWVLKPHGYRRSIAEIVATAARHGFRLGRIRHAGFGVELTRVYLDRVPPLYRLARAIDRRVHIFNNTVVFEFLT